MRGRRRALHVDAAAYEHDIGLADAFGRTGVDRQAVARRDRAAVGADHRPSVQRLTAQVVRHPKHLDRIRERDHREVR